MSGVEPTDEEMAAIAAAVQAVWPEPVAVAGEAPRSVSWRFSGRWWARPLATRRDRPYR